MLEYQQPEVTDINKQKFLAELGKLLTFMYDEDRQAALAMYSKMFDNTRDEQSLLQFLVSPTRQAVVIARAYNARERKLQVSSQSREGRPEDGEGSPDYMRAIEELESEAINRKIITPEVSADQFSLFEDGVHPLEQEDSGTYDEAAQDTAPEDAASAAGEPDESAAAELPQPAKAEAVAIEDEDGQPEAAPAEEPESAADGEEAAESAEAPEAGGEPAVKAEGEAVPVEEDDVDAFLSDFSIKNDELEAPAAAPAGKKDERRETAKPAERKGEKVVPVKPADDPEFGFGPAYRAKPAEAQDAQAVDMTVRKPKVALLILYIIIAVPLIALCVALLLIPTLAFLALAAAAVVLGCVTLTSAFGAFSIFADVMVVLGCSMVTLALGLLFMWIFVWFIGGAIAGLINAIIKLGGKWCYKEVPAV